MAKEPAKKPLAAPTEGTNHELAEEIARRLDSLVPPGQRSQVVAQVVSLVQRERFSGPIAHPRHLREYEEIEPGAANRIITMAENSLTHSHEMQSRALAADIDDTKDGRRYGFAALVLLILSALLCGYLDNNTLALAFLGAGALGVVATFIKGRQNGGGQSGGAQ